MLENSDQQLLEKFLSGDKIAALDQIFKNYNQLVKGICLCVLQNEHDNTLTATFLVFTSKTSFIQWTEDLSSWFWGWRSASLGS